MGLRSIIYQHAAVDSARAACFVEGCAYHSSSMSHPIGSSLSIKSAARATASSMYVKEQTYYTVAASLNRCLQVIPRLPDQIARSFCYLDREAQKESALVISNKIQPELQTQTTNATDGAARLQDGHHTRAWAQSGLGARLAQTSVPSSERIHTPAQ